MCRDQGSNLYVGGAFTTAGDGTATNIAKWDMTKTDNTGWSALGSSLGNEVKALAVSNTDLYVGGSFTANQGGTPGTLNRIAKWDTTTSTWSALGSGLGGTVVYVNALAVSGSNLTFTHT